MTGISDRIDPRPIWPTLRNPFSSAAEAFEAGNYPLALDMAEDGSELRAAAMIMCGAIVIGMASLAKFESPRARLIRAYGHWCLNQVSEAQKLLGELRRTDLGAAAETFLSFLEAPLDVVLLGMPGERNEAYTDIPGIRTHWIQLDVDAFGTTMTDALATLPLDAVPRLLLSLNAYGPYLPQAPNAPGIPLAFWVSDHDYFFATRYAALTAADVIVANSAAEQIETNRHYPARCAAIPGHENYRSMKSIPLETTRDLDIFFSGRAFAPYMRDKAQFLFRLATIDDPALRIDIIDGYLSDPEYLAALEHAKFVPLFWRSAGGLQTRAIEAMRAGASVLSPERGIARSLLGDAAALYRWAIDADVSAILRDRRPSGSAVARDLNDLFWPSPEREARLLKFCLFQTLFTSSRQNPSPTSDFTPVELRGYGLADGTQIYTRVAKMNGESETPDTPHYLHAAAAAFYAAVLLSNTPSAGTGIAQMALDFYRTGITAFPRSLALRFNGARAMWTFGQRDEALAEFQAIVERLPDLAFDARTDALLSHRIRVLADMFPYGDFYRAAVEPSQIQSRALGAREFIASSALTYIALDLIERGEVAASLGILQRAVERCDVNVAGWRLLTRALAATRASPNMIRDAFYQTVNLHPPELIDLMPMGLDAELAEGRRAQAADILRDWVLVRARTRDTAGQPPAASEAAIEAARHHRDLLADWTAQLFDRIVTPQ